jgi:glycosyltransferase involved in cell wall biosynthesis
MPLISVIIPAYNAEKTIRKTVESVLNQTFADFELIIVDDGSQDLTVEIISRLLEPRIKVFSYPHTGSNPTRNRGFSHSVGEFVAFLDSDDLWTPDKLEEQLKALQTNPKAAVAYSWTDCIDESDQYLWLGSHMTENGNVYAKLLLTCFVVSGSNPLIRRQAFIDIGGFDESLAASQDFDLYLRLAARYEFVAVPYPQVLYRISTKSKSMCSNVRRQEETSLLVRKRAFAQAPEPLSDSLKNHSIANFYKSVLHKLLNDPPNREIGLECARLLGNAIKYDSTLVRKKVFLKIVYKISVFIIFPSQYAQFLIDRFNKLSNINILPSYIKVEPSELN